MRRRDRGQAKAGPGRRFHARMPTSRGGAAACDGFKPTSLRARGGADDGERARGGHVASAGAGTREVTRGPAKFARAAMRLLRGADGNTVQTTAPPTAPA